MMKNVALLLTLFTIFLWISFYAFLGENGNAKYQQSKENIALLIQNNNRLIAKNKQLLNKLNRVKESPEYFEHYIRTKTSLIRENEIIYQFR